MENFPHTPSKLSPQLNGDVSTTCVNGGKIGNVSKQFVRYCRQAVRDHRDPDSSTIVDFHKERTVHFRVRATSLGARPHHLCVSETSFARKRNTTARRATKKLPRPIRTWKHAVPPDFTRLACTLKARNEGDPLQITKRLSVLRMHRSKATSSLRVRGLAPTVPSLSTVRPYYSLS